MKLTKRQTEILKLAKSGLSQGLIAERLQISVNTVYAHLQKAYAMLGAYNIVQAINIANNKKLL